MSILGGEELNKLQCSSSQKSCEQRKRTDCDIRSNKEKEPSENLELSVKAHKRIIYAV